MKVDSGSMNQNFINKIQYVVEKRYFIINKFQIIIEHYIYFPL